jgi:hypothetical protein
VDSETSEHSPLVTNARASEILGIASVQSAVNRGALKIANAHRGKSFFYLNDVLAYREHRDRYRHGTRHQLSNLLGLFADQQSSGLDDRQWRICKRYAATDDTYEMIAYDECVKRQRIGDIVSKCLKKLRDRAEELERLPAGISEPTSDWNELERRVQWLKLWGYYGLDSDPPAVCLAPRLMHTTTPVYQRDPAVKAWILHKARGLCELCDKPGPFLRPDGERFLETHHVIELGSGGTDTVNNVVALCPTCHRRLHFGEDAIDQRERLYAKVDRLSGDGNEARATV